MLGFDGIVGNYASPYTPGSAYVLLHHVFGEVNGMKGAWGHAIGGMGAITQAMAKRRRGGVSKSHLRRCARNHRRAGSAVGVVTDKGDFSAQVNRLQRQSETALQRLVDRSMPPNLCARIENWRCGSGTFRMNVASRHCPSFTALPGEGDHLTAGIIMAPSLDYMDRAYLDARANGWSTSPSSKC